MGSVFYLFIFAFDCSLEILERKDCWCSEGKWVRDGQKLYLEGKWENVSIFFFGCSLEMFEGNDYLYLEGKWATIVCIWRANGLGKVGITKKKKKNLT